MAQSSALQNHNKVCVVRSMWLRAVPREGASTLNQPPRVLFLELFPLFLELLQLRIHRRHTLMQALPLGLALLFSAHEETFS